MPLRLVSHFFASVRPIYSRWPSIFLHATPNATRSPRTDSPPTPSWPCKAIRFRVAFGEPEHLIERVVVQGGRTSHHRRTKQEELTKAINPTDGSSDFQSATALPFHEAVASWERHLIEQALKASHGNKSDAARRLGIHRRLLYEKLTQFGML
jgi:DNA-binding protein Fis